MKGALGQELKVGDVIAFIARSGGSYRQAICKIVFIDEPTKVMKVENVGIRYRYNELTNNWVSSKIVYKVRIYNWSSAITLNIDWDERLKNECIIRSNKNV